MTPEDRRFADCLNAVVTEHERVRMQQAANRFMQSVERDWTEAEIAQAARDERADAWAAKTWRA